MQVKNELTLSRWLISYAPGLPCGRQIVAYNAETSKSKLLKSGDVNGKTEAFANLGLFGFAQRGDSDEGLTLDPMTRLNPKSGTSAPACQKFANENMSGPVRSAVCETHGKTRPAALAESRRDKEVV